MRLKGDYFGFVENFEYIKFYKISDIKSATERLPT